MYSYNIFGCKLLALRSQSERVFNAIHYFARYLYNTSGTAGKVKECQILMESEMFRYKSIIIQPTKILLNS